MKSHVIPLIAMLVFSVSCSAGRMSEATTAAPTQTASAPQRAASAAEPLKDSEETTRGFVAEAQKVSLTEVDQTQLTNEAADRKIIRNAEVTMEVESTTDAQHRISSIAEKHGGFVVTSESKQRENIDPSKRTLDIKLVVRIPAGRFGAVLDEVKQLSGNLTAENVSGQDVTEEFIDLEARIKTQKALELQFLEIMKQARKIGDALEVQRQISEVRTDIERLEGRKRFLENRSSLSTITVNIQAPKMIAVNPSGVGHSVREAVSESLDLASGMLVFFVRTVIVMMPVLIFVILPGGLVLRYLWRRSNRVRLAQQLATPTAD